MREVVNTSAAKNMNKHREIIIEQGPQRRRREQLKSYRFPLRQRTDVILSASLLLVFILLALLWGTGLLVTEQLNLFPSKTVKPLPDPRILANIRSNIRQNSILSAAFHPGDGHLYLSKKDGLIHRYHPQTLTWQTEPDLRSLLLAPGLTMLRAGNGNDPLSNTYPGDLGPPMLWGLGENQSLVRRRGGQWQTAVSDSVFFGTQQAPVPEGQLTAAAVSADGKWLAIGTREHGPGLYHLGLHAWIPIPYPALQALPSPAVTHITWWRGLFWLGTPNGLAALNPSHRLEKKHAPLPAIFPIRGARGKVTDLDRDRQDRLWVLENRSCPGGGCIRLLRFDAPDQEPEPVIDEKNLYPRLDGSGLHFACLMDNRLVVAGTAGLYSYRPRDHLWERHLDKAVLTVLRTEDKKGFYFGSAGGAGKIEEGGEPWNIPPERQNQWFVTLPGQRVTRVSAGDPKTGEFLALARSGRCYSIRGGQVSRVAATENTLHNPALFIAAFAFGNHVLLAGEKGGVVHDVVNRTYTDFPGASLPPWFRAPGPFFVTSGKNTYIAAQQENKTHLYYLPTAAVTAGQLRAARHAGAVEGPPRRMLPLDSGGVVLACGGPEGRVVSFTPKPTPLIGPPGKRHLPQQLLDVIPYKNGMAAATDQGLQYYDYRSRAWTLYGNPPGSTPAELVDGADRLLAVTEDQRLVRWERAGGFNPLVGSPVRGGMDIPSHQVSDAVVHEGKLYLGGAGAVFRYDPDLRQFTHRWNLPGPGEWVKIRGFAGGEPLTLCGGKACLGIRTIDRNAGSVTNLSMDNRFIWTVRQRGNRKYLKRYPLANPLKSPGTAYFFSPTAGPGANRVKDALEFPALKNTIAALTEKGLRFYNHHYRSWYRGLPLSWFPAGGRLHLLGEHLLVQGGSRGEFQLAFIPAKALELPTGGSGGNITLSRPPVRTTARSFCIDTAGKRAAFIDDRGRIRQWKGGKAATLFSPGARVPDTERFRHVFDRSGPGAGGFLLFTTSGGIWSYHLPRHKWRYHPLELPGPADIRLLRQDGREVVIAGTRGSGFYTGSFKALSAKTPSIRAPHFQPLYHLSSPSIHTGQRLLDAQQRSGRFGKRGDWWTFIHRGGMSYFDPGERRWKGDVTLSAASGNHGFYRVGPRGVAAEPGGERWWVAKDKGPHPTAFALYRKQPHRQTAVDQKGAIWRLAPDGTLYRLPLPAGGFYPEDHGPYVYRPAAGGRSSGIDPRPVLRLSVNSSGKLLAHYARGTRKLANKAVIRFGASHLPPALDAGWIKWERQEKRFQVRGVKGFLPLRPDEIVSGSRFIFEEIGALLFTGDNRAYAANGWGIWNYRGVDLSLADATITFRPMNWGDRIYAAHGRFAAGGKLYGPDGSTLPASRRYYRFDVGDVSFSEDILASGVSAVIKGAGQRGRAALEKKGFTWDRGIEDIYYGAGGNILVKSGAGYHPLKGYSGFSTRLSSHPTAPGQIVPSTPVPRDRDLIDSPRWTWKKRGDAVEVRLKGESYGFQSISGPRGVGFTSDQLQDARVFRDRLFILTSAFLEIAESPGAPGFTRHANPRGTALDLLPEAGQGGRLFLYGGGRYYYWDGEDSEFKGAETGDHPRRERAVAQLPMNRPRLRFLRGMNSPVKMQLNRRFTRGPGAGGTDTDDWETFRLMRNRFPIDIVESAGVDRGRIWVKSPAGTTVYPLGSPPAAPLSQMEAPAGAIDPATSSRVRVDTPFWRFTRQGGRLTGYYKNREGKTSGPAIVLRGGRFPHDRPLDIAGFGNRLYTLWGDGRVTGFKGASLGLDNITGMYHIPSANLKDFVTVTSDIHPSGPGRPAIPRGLYLREMGGMGRFFQLTAGGWREILGAALRDLLGRYAQAPPLMQRGNLRLLDTRPYVFQYRDRGGTWRPLPWKEGRVAIDFRSHLFYLDNRPWFATPAGLASFERSAEGRIILDPEKLTVIREPAVGNRLPEVTDIRVEGDRLTLRCNADSSQVYRGALTFPLKSGAVFSSLGTDPFVRRQWIDKKETGSWSWSLEGCRDRNPGRLEGRLNGELIRLTGGRFDFDTIQSLAFFREDRVDIGTRAGGWYQTADEGFSPFKFQRPKVHGIDARAVNGVSMGREGAEPLLGLRTVTGEYFRVRASGEFQRTRGFAEFLGDDGFWLYLKENNQLVITTPHGRGNLNRRRLKGGRFSDGIALGPPVTVKEEEGPRFYVPTEAGVLVLDEKLGRRLLYSGPFPGLNGGDGASVPRVLTVDSEGKVLYAAGGGLYRLEGDRGKVPEVQVPLPEGGVLTALEKGPADYTRIRWKIEDNRGWSLYRAGETTVAQRVCSVDIGAFGKYIKNRGKWGSPAPRLHLRLDERGMSVSGENRPDVYRLDIPNMPEVLGMFPVGERLYLIGRRQPWVVNLEQVMEKSFSK